MPSLCSFSRRAGLGTAFVENSGTRSCPESGVRGLVWTTDDTRGIPVSCASKLTFSR